MIYLDNASTTATDPRVIEFMQPYFFELYGNASGRYSLGFKSQKAIKDAREKAAALINAEPDEIVFTSGGTESNNTVLSKGLNCQIKNFTMVDFQTPDFQIITVKSHLYNSKFSFLNKCFFESGYHRVKSFIAISGKLFSSSIAIPFLRYK